jgi:hypothetical protein
MVSSINMGSNEQREPCAAASGMYGASECIYVTNTKRYIRRFSVARCISIGAVHTTYMHVN